MKMVIIGAGGFGREVMDIVDAVNATSPAERIDVLGFVDGGTPDPATLAPYGLGIVGGVSELGKMPPDTRFVIGVGSPSARAALDRAAIGAGLLATSLVHPSATFGRSVSIGEGSVICAGVRVTNNVTLGRHVHLNLNATVGHDATLGDFVTVSPLVAISGYATLEEEVMIGTGVTVNPGVTIGAGATIGSGAAVLKDIAPGMTAVGIPAKPR